MSLGDGLYVDGSWELSILVEDLQLTRRIRVNGETHIGGLMLLLVEAIDVRMDWSDHGLWWPARNRWLLKTRRTLDQCGVQSDARLEFHRMHDYARVQLPDFRELDLWLSFAQSVFSVVVTICRELDIRHPEELSLQGDPADSGSGGGGGGGVFDSNGGTLFRTNKRNKKQQQSSPLRSSPLSSSGNMNNPLVPRTQLIAAPPSGGSSPRSATGFSATVASLGSLGDSLDGGLAASPVRRRQSTPAGGGGGQLPQTSAPRTPLERAAASGVDTWLDSARSLMEQGLRPGVMATPLRLRFKFHAHYDLNPQLDAVRINQLFEQVKWSVLSGCQPCTDEEALLLAALQLQAQLGSPTEPELQQGPLTPAPAPAPVPTPAMSQDAQLDAEIDAAIASLERSLSSPSASATAAPDAVPAAAREALIEQVPELAAWLKVSCQQKQQLHQSTQSLLLSTLSLRAEAKRRYLVLRETRLLVCTSVEAAAAGNEPTVSLSIFGAEVIPESSGGRLSIRLLPSGVDSSSGWWQVRFPAAARRQFAEWSAGLSLAARGRTLASREMFAAEVRDTMARLELQCPRVGISEADEAGELVDIDPADYLPQSALKRTGGSRSRALAARILERRSKVRDRARIDAKLDYIRAWQRLPMSGVACFSVAYSETPPPAQITSLAEFRRERHNQQHPRVELFGVAFNRVMRLDAQTGDAVTTWRYQEIDSWTVNWEVLSVSVTLRRPPNYICLTPCASQPQLKQALCKTLVELIGGYVFLSLRKPDKSQELDEQMFHRLTCCREPPAS